MIFKRTETAFIGRNGYFKMAGISVGLYGSILHLEPITSRGQIGRALLEIPVEEVETFIAEIRTKLKEKRDEEVADGFVQGSSVSGIDSSF